MAAFNRFDTDNMNPWSEGGDAKISAPYHSGELSELLLRLASGSYESTEAEPIEYPAQTDLPPNSGEVLVGETYIRFPYLPNTAAEREAWRRTAVDMRNDELIRARTSAEEEAAWRDYDPAAYRSNPAGAHNVVHRQQRLDDEDLPPTYDFADRHTLNHITNTSNWMIADTQRRNIGQAIGRLWQSIKGADHGLGPLMSEKVILDIRLRIRARYDQPDTDEQ